MSTTGIPTPGRHRSVTQGSFRAKHGGPYRVLVLPDMQVPYHDQRAIKPVLSYAKDVGPWDEVIVLGDFLDFDCISSHNAHNLRQVEGKSVQADYDAGNAVLDEIQSVCKGAKLTLLEGNHEFRIERYLDAAPQLKGLLEVEKGLRLKQRGARWVRCYQHGEVYRLGKAYFHHGLYTSSNHAKKMVEAFGVNVFYGHCHDVICWPLTQWGKDKTVVGQSMGCLCLPDLQYNKNNPSNWQQAFGTFYFLPDGSFTYYVTRLVDHRFVAPNGKVYKG